MNGKKAKLLRKIGKKSRRSKKLYNVLSEEEKILLTKICNKHFEKYPNK